MSTWIVIGATSAMGEAFARLVAGKDHDLIVTARKKPELSSIASDLDLRGNGTVEGILLDLDRPNTLRDLFDRAAGTAGEINVAFFAGAMADQADLNANPDLIDASFRQNLEAPAKILMYLANIIEDRGTGRIICLSSVAGDRGRASNYVYGSAKAGLTAFLSGLRNRLAPHGIPVLTVKPGFVDTDMTWGLPGLFLVADPSDIAAKIWAASEKGRSTLYVPWFWWIIMTIIRHIPEPIFKKLKL